VHQGQQAVNDLTIISYTDNSLPFWLRNRCRQELVKAAEGKRIITVSQQPLPWDDVIVLQGLPRCHHSLFTQAITGVKAATTRYVAMAEHDCMYTPEHFNWRPADDKIFWYNINHYLAYVEQSRYAYVRRKPMSQLICERDIFISAVEEKIRMLETGFEIAKGVSGACEPGVCDNRKAFKAAKTEWWNAMKDVGKEPQWTAKGFSTVLPNLDIRHGKNFSPGYRVKAETETLPYWGDFKEYLYAQ
jgi:hypothetical protein